MGLNSPQDMQKAELREDIAKIKAMFGCRWNLQDGDSLDNLISNAPYCVDLSMKSINWGDCRQQLQPVIENWMADAGGDITEESWNRYANFIDCLKWYAAPKWAMDATEKSVMWNEELEMYEEVLETGIDIGTAKFSLQLDPGDFEHVDVDDDGPGCHWSKPLERTTDKVLETIFGRDMRGWTQEQLADALKAHILGVLAGANKAWLVKIWEEDKAISEYVNRCFDIDLDGTISEAELYHFSSLVCPDDDEEIEAMVETMRGMGVEGMSVEDFIAGPLTQFNMSPEEAIDKLNWTLGLQVQQVHGYHGTPFDVNC